MRCIFTLGLALCAASVCVAEEKAEWPDVDAVKDVVGSVSDAAKDVVDKTKSASSSAVSKAAERLAGAMREVAKGITLLLEKVDIKATAMLEGVAEQKKALLAAAVGDQTTDEQAFVTAFSDALQTYLDDASHSMRQVMTEVAGADAGIQKALEVAGQTTLASKVHSSMKTAIDSIDTFRESLVAAAASFKEVGARAPATLRERIDTIDTSFEEQLAKVKGFQQPFKDAVWQLVDGINTYSTELLSEDLSAVVRDAFGEVQQKATATSDHVTEASTAAITGLKEARTVYEASPAQQTEATTVAPMPKMSPSVAEQSGARRLGLGLLAAALCAAVLRI